MKNIVPMCSYVGYIGTMLNWYDGKLGHHLVLNSQTEIDTYLYTIIFNNIKIS